MIKYQLILNNAAYVVQEDAEITSESQHCIADGGEA